MSVTLKRKLANLLDRPGGRQFLSSIASHWARKNIKTVTEAMELAKMEHRQYAEWAEGNKSGNKTNYKKKPIRTEVLPDWFDNEEKMEKPSQRKHDKSAELKKQEIDEMLKKLRS